MPRPEPYRFRSPKHQGKTLKRLLRLIWERYKWWLIVVFFCILISSIAGVIGSLFLQVLIDNYIVPLEKMAHPDFSGLFRAILQMAGIYLLGVLANLLSNQFMVVVSQGVLKEIRDKMFAHMQTLPLKYFDTHSHGDLMSHYTNDTDTLRQMISQSLPNLLSSLTTIVAVFSAMVSTSLHLTGIVIVTITIMYFVSRYVTGNSRKYFLNQQIALGKTNGYIEEMTNGQKVIKVFNYEEEAKKRFDVLNEELRRQSTEANRFANILMPLMGNINNVQYVFIALIGGILVAKNIGGLTLGGIASFLQLSRTLGGPINQVAMQLNAVVMALAGADRIFRLMDEAPETDEGSVTLVNVRMENGELVETEERTGLWAWKQPNPDGTFTYTQLRGDVRFEDVDFGYEPGKTVLHDIQLYAEPGQKVAFVGATGAGKTTITNLINRFYDIQKGRILYDGIDVKQIRKQDLRRSLGIVLQDTHLFSGTIRDNIRYGKLDATDEEVEAAAKLANADKFINLLPEKYDTYITADGGSLSQGQRQLLAIARAAIADPPVMIMDEATSSIDTRTESIVQRGMDALMEGRTVFVIAHRLSTVKNSDVIMVMDHGRIIERGNHESLLEKKGKYYQLYTGKIELE